MDNIKTLPLYAKLSLITMGLLALFCILYFGQSILIPFIFSLIVAILLNPMVNFLYRKKVNRIVAIFMAMTVGLLIVAGLGFFIGSQATMFSDSMPEFKQKFSILYYDIIDWVSQTFKISKIKIDAWIDKMKIEGMDNSSVLIGRTIGTLSGVLVFTFLLPVYIFMILFYKSLLLEFIAQLFKQDKHIAAEVLVETKTLIQSYLVGLLFETVLVATLNSIGLLIIGIEYAILIGIIGALLNIIPYIGGLIAISIPMLIAVATKSPIDALWVFIVYMVVQFIDNNIFVPRIVASKVKINGLVSIFVVLSGGALWGVAGMFLSIPLIAIVKVVFDRVEALKPFGFLIGDNQPDIGKVIFNFKSRTK